MTTALIFNNNHYLHNDPSSERRYKGRGPFNDERKERIDELRKELKARYVFENPTINVLKEERLPTLEELTRVHDPKYLEELEFLSYLEEATEDPPSRKFFEEKEGTYFTEHTYTAALSAAGASIELAEHVARNSGTNGFALVRPPGHHTRKDKAAGFCFLNNVALAARAVQALGIERVFIFDFDVHHGDGTESIFENDRSVFYCSTHQHGTDKEGDLLYPGTGAATNGNKFIKNIPLRAGIGNETYEDLVRKEVLPTIKKYKPGIILVSAGFDLHRDDPVKEIPTKVTATGFRKTTRMLLDTAADVCDGKLVYFLEGGYNTRALSKSVYACINELSSTKTLYQTPEETTDLAHRV